MSKKNLSKSVFVSLIQGTLRTRSINQLKRGFILLVVIRKHLTSCPKLWLVFIWKKYFSQMVLGTTNGTLNVQLHCKIVLSNIQQTKLPLSLIINKINSAPKNVMFKKGGDQGLWWGLWLSLPLPDWEFWRYLHKGSQCKYKDLLMRDQFIAGSTFKALSVKLIGKGHRHWDSQIKVALREVVEAAKCFEATTYTNQLMKTARGNQKQVNFAGK